jgi:hypothetical protein
LVLVFEKAQGDGILQNTRGENHERFEGFKFESKRGQK